MNKEWVESTINKIDVWKQTKSIPEAIDLLNQIYDDLVKSK